MKARPETLKKEMDRLERLYKKDPTNDALTMGYINSISNYSISLLRGVKGPKSKAKRKHNYYLEKMADIIDERKLYKKLKTNDNYSTVCNMYESVRGCTKR